KRGRKLYYLWLEERARMKVSEADHRERDKACAWQDAMAHQLETAYGYAIVDFFLTADDEDSTGGVLSETQEFAGRIKRLRTIIERVRTGKIRPIQQLDC